METVRNVAAHTRSDNVVITWMFYRWFRHLCNRLFFIVIPIFLWLWIGGGIELFFTWRQSRVEENESREKRTSGWGENFDKPSGIASVMQRPWPKRIQWEFLIRGIARRFFSGVFFIEHLLDKVSNTSKGERLLLLTYQRIFTFFSKFGGSRSLCRE